MPSYVQANTDGHLHDAAVASLSPLNRGFLYGDAVYEVWRTYHGVLFAFEEHWARLQRSAAALRFEIPFSAATLIEEIRRTAAAFRDHEQHAGDLYVRLQLTRGAGPIGLDPALADRASWVLLVQQLAPAALAAGRRGMHLSIAQQLRRNPATALNPAWKTGNYLNNLLCLREARARGADEVVILNEHGALSECAVCNIFFARGNTLVTPPLNAGILEGITRQLIVDRIGTDAGYTVEERNVHPSELGSFEECFLSSSTRDVTAVGAIDEHRYRVGADTAAARVKRCFADYTAAYARQRPDLKV